MPERIGRLPVDRGYPVPWFVEWIDGKPEFRIADGRKLRDAVRFDLCWICGEHRGRNVSFVIGPMCAVNRVSAEPPAHRDCAIYSAQRCPFLANPAMRRRERHLPEDAAVPAGISIPRNPGVALVWSTRDYRIVPADGGVLFHLGDPLETLWFAHGRPATRDEVMGSIDTGLPILRDMAEQDGAAAVRQLDEQLRTALMLVPLAARP
jgi:hypothetical protein